MNDTRDMRGMDGRNPYGSRGGYVVSSRGRGRGRGRGRRGDRGMDYGMDGRVINSYPTIHPQGSYAGDMNYDMARGGNQGARGRGDRGDYGSYDMARGQDMRSMDYRGSDYRGDYGDMHHGGMGRGGYEPVEFMGYCSGYYGAPQDYGRRDDYAYDMRGRRDYGYPDYGDYGETLSDKELEHWEKRLMAELNDQEKQMFHKDTIMQKIRAMNLQMQGFGEKELCAATLMVYTDYKNTIGQNVDMSIRLAYDWLSDKDAAVRGAEKLGVYYDCIVEGGDD